MSKQYAREIQEHSLQMERFYEENDEEDLLDPQQYDDDSVTGDDDEHEYVPIDENGNDNNQQWVFEVDNNGEYRIFEQRKERKTSIANSRKTYKINVKQNPKDFSWAMFKSGKKIKTHYNTYHGGYWWILDEDIVEKERNNWHNKLSDKTKRQKQKLQFKKKGKVKKWIGPSIKVKHLNIILGLVNHHYKIMIDPAKRKKIWKKKRGKKEPIFYKFLPKGIVYCIFGAFH